jgi:biopolymer transport protein ExbB
VIADGATVETPRTAPLQLNQWQHVALTVTPLRVTLYVDGMEAAAIDTKAVDMAGAITVGAAAIGSNFLSGEIDQLEIAKLARPAQWFKDEFAGQGPDATALSYGEDEQGDSGGGTSYFGTILRSVTVDGWVVIAVLMLMAAISWLVMASKAFVIKKVGADDREFLHAYHKLAPAQTDALDQSEDDVSIEMDDSDLLTAVFGKQEHYQNSPLFRIYHSGIHELKLRFGKSAGAAASGLSPQAVSAIRAALDATMVRELQKLNSQMVLLTIAISGGPFLGLLGTVVGVMITFAAIAATGDVNINAIAPGIAAALVATVAGLAVAIPALFGYNYLGSRIKSLSADMQVFVDEFIGRIAESYQR